MSNTLLISGADVLTMRDNRVLTGQDLLITDGKINKIQPTGQLTAENKIDGKGCFLMPGFCDMHVHLTTEKDDLFLYLANGVTTIRNMAGMQLPSWTKIIPGLGFVRHLDVKNDIAGGRLTGPEIFTGTPILDTPPFDYPWPASNKVTTEGQVPGLIRKFKQQGFDFIKIYYKLSEVLFKAIILHGHNMDLQVGGHVPNALRIDDAINAGIDFIEHLTGYINTGIPHGNDVKAEEFDRLVHLTVEKGVWNCPTLLVWKTMNQWLRFGEFKTLQYLDYLPSRSFGSYIRQTSTYKKKITTLIKRQLKQFKKPNKNSLDTIQIVQNYKQLAPLVKKLHENGALLMTGTDANVPFVVPGFSLHEEFQMLAEAGISNNDILRMTTCLPARFLGRGQETGVVAEGMLANLVLLNADPREDIRNTKKIAGVVRRGQWFAAEMLQQGLDEIKAKHSRSNRKHFKVMQAEVEKQPG